MAFYTLIIAISRAHLASYLPQWRCRGDIRAVCAVRDFLCTGRAKLPLRPGGFMTPHSNHVTGNNILITRSVDLPRDSRDKDPKSRQTSIWMLLRLPTLGVRWSWLSTLVAPGQGPHIITTMLPEPGKHRGHSKVVRFMCRWREERDLFGPRALRYYLLSPRPQKAGHRNTRYHCHAPIYCRETLKVAQLTTAY